MKNHVMEIGGGDGTFYEDDHLVKTLVDIDNYFEGPLQKEGSGSPNVILSSSKKMNLI